jgi:hypothetical protein
VFWSVLTILQGIANFFQFFHLKNGRGCRLFIFYHVDHVWPWPVHIRDGRKFLKFPTVEIGVRFAKKSLLLLVAPDLEQLLFKSDVILSWSLTRFQMEKKVKPSVPPLLSLDYKIDSLKLHRETFPPSPFSESGDFHKNSIPPKWIKPWSRRVRRSNLIQFGPRLRRNPRKQIRNDTVTARKDSCIRSGAGRDGGGPMHL